MAHLRLSFNNEQASDERVRAAPVPALHVWVFACAARAQPGSMRFLKFKNYKF